MRTRRPNPPPNGYLKISDVARQVGMSATVLRGWERLGLIKPVRTDSAYRLYTRDDVNLLKRARYLRLRGLNPKAIVAQLRQQGFLDPSAGGSSDAETDTIGPQLRKARMQQGRSLAQVAKACDISVGFLSAIERSQMSASVATLQRIARYYGMNVLDLFNPGEGGPVVRKNERRVLAGGEGVKMELLARGHPVMEPHLFRVAPGAGSGSAYSHEGEEFMHLLDGELTIKLGGNTHHLRSGDSLYFESSTPHQWHNPGRKETVILWINTPPTF
jgi:DNA-binding transcriptional MerR regulator/quercetin dioxygenase-like cupin family protein